MRARAVEGDTVRQKVNEAGRVALVDAAAVGQHVQVVEHFEHARARLVDHADDRPAAQSEPLEYRHALEARRAVQATVQFDQLFMSSLRHLDKRVYLVGSSRNMTGGLLTISKAMDSLFFCPPDNLSVLVLIDGSRPIVSRISSI